MESFPLVLLILDGWGLRSAREGNAIELARLPVYRELLAAYPSTELAASGLEVGLPDGVMGNSEVGHMNLGAGRIAWQDITRIDRAMVSGEFFRNEAFLGVVRAVRDRGGSLHLMGLVSDGAVHSMDRHYEALVDLARREGLEARKVFFHAFLDGRDTPPKSALGYVARLATVLRKGGVGRIATASGRYYAMDRDNRWDRTQRAYDCLTRGLGRHARDPIGAVREAYEQGETDEFVSPTAIVDDQGPIGLVRNGDGVIFFNFRADRARQLTKAFTQKNFDGFPRTVSPAVSFATMTPYDATFDLPAAFHPLSYPNTFGEVLSREKIPQMRIAETEKYAHVTYFFNCGREQPFEGEERVLMASLKVATYDKQPEMRAREIAERIVQEIGARKYRVIVGNFANPDMVGHTGDLAATVRALETVDECFGRLRQAVLGAQGVLVITADHGNCEQMIDKGGGPHTYHTTNPVPFLLISEKHRPAKLRPSGRLSDAAPTLLELLGMPKPAEMEGQSLLQR